MTKNKWMTRVIFFVGISVILGSIYTWAKEARTGGQEGKTISIDPWKVLQEINRYYQTDQVIKQACEIKLHSQNNPTVILEQYDCLYLISNEQVYSRIGPVETYGDKEIMVTADKENMLISLMPPDPAMLENNMPAMKQLQKLVREVKGELTIVEEAGKEVLSFRSELNPEIKSYRIYYDPKTWRIEKIRMEVWEQDAYMQESPRPLVMDISFSPMNKLDQFPEEFGKARFIRHVTDSVLLQSGYAEYEWINDPNEMPVNQ